MLAARRDGRTHTGAPWRRFSASTCPGVICAQKAESPLRKSARTSKPTRLQPLDLRRDRRIVWCLEDVDVMGAQQPAVELGDRADESHHELVCRTIVQVVGPSDLLNSAGVDHHQLV